MNEKNEKPTRHAETWSWWVTSAPELDDLAPIQLLLADQFTTKDGSKPDYTEVQKRHLAPHWSLRLKTVMMQMGFSRVAEEEYAAPSASAQPAERKALIDRLTGHFEDKRNTAFARSCMLEAIEYLSATPAPTQGTQEPVGWKLVPVHPTPEMRAAGAKINGQGWDFAHHTWNTMLLNAPNYVDLAAPASVAAPAALTDSYVQTVPDHCDRIVWRNAYYHLPLAASPAALTDDALIDAANARAALYDDDDRPCIKTDVMNAFYAGAEFAKRASPADQGEDARDAVMLELLESYEAIFRSAYCQLDADDDLIRRVRAAMSASKVKS